MDKNLQFLVRHNTFTVDVRLNAEPGKVYTFVSDHSELKLNSVVVVDTVNGMQLGTVVAVHDDLRIEVGSSIQYKWVVAVVDTKPHELHIAQDKRLRAVANQKMRENARQTMQALLGVSPSDIMAIVNDAGTV